MVVYLLLKTSTNKIRIELNMYKSNITTSNCLFLRIFCSVLNLQWCKNEAIIQYYINNIKYLYITTCYEINFYPVSHSNPSFVYSSNLVASQNVSETSISISHISITYFKLIIVRPIIIIA